MNQQTLEQSIAIIKSFSVQALQAGLYKSFETADALRYAITNVEKHLEAVQQQKKADPEKTLPIKS